MVSAGDGKPGPERPRHPASPSGPVWHFCLFVAGGHDRSRRAIENLRMLCATHLPSGAEVEVVDVHRAPSLATYHRVGVVPMLLRLSPPPLRRVVGDLSDTHTVLRGLDLPTDRHAGG